MEQITVRIAQRKYRWMALRLAFTCPTCQCGGWYSHISLLAVQRLWSILCFSITRMPSHRRLLGPFFRESVSCSQQCILKPSQQFFTLWLKAHVPNNLNETYKFLGMNEGIDAFYIVGLMFLIPAVPLVTFVTRCAAPTPLADDIPEGQHLRDEESR